MKKLYFIAILMVLSLLSAETLFEVKDASDQTVLEVASDGLRIFNAGDTLMVISSSEIKAFIDNSKDKALSRSFSVTTSTSAKGTGDIVNIASDGLRVYNENDKLMDITGNNITAYIDSSDSKALSRSFSVTTSTSAKDGYNVMEVTNSSTTMREGDLGDQYTNFSPDNLFLGLRAGQQTTTGANNIFIGNDCGTLNYYGDDNIYIGYQAGYKNDYASENIFVGNYAGYNNDTDDPSPYGSMNVFLGTYSGYSNIDGYVNTFVGYRSGEDNRGASENTYVGGYAGSNNNSSRNVAVGVSALGSNTSGTQNTAIGTYSGNSNLTGSRNVFLGYRAGYNETGSDKLYIDNSDTSTPLIWGDFNANTLRFNGNVGINVAPSSSYGLYAFDDYRGVYGYAYTSADDYTYGVYGYGYGGAVRNVGVYGNSGGTGTNWSGYFVGNVYVGGTVSKSADQVKIDHPLDPENKTLSHSTIASNQMTNIYHGNVVLDSDGKAVVELADWVEEINKDFRYQLTAIGAPGPNLYISKKIKENTFEIAGGSEGMEVSWQVTGIRNDKFAQKNPLEVEKDKNNDEKGYYIHPAAYGLPEERGIENHIQKIENR